MSPTRSEGGDHADAIKLATREIAGLIRRMAITLTSSAIWQVAGHVLLDGKRETRKAENFGGIGIYARPPTGGSPEAIVVFPGGAANAIIVGARDEKTRREVFKAAGDLAAGETAMFTPNAIVVLKADGTVEIRSPSNPLVQPTILGTAYRGAEDTMLSLMSVAFTTLLTIPSIAAAILLLTAPQQAAIAAFATSITSFQSGEAAYLTTVAKVQ